VGPFTSLNCKLSLTNNGIRISDEVQGGYGDPLTTVGDTRFTKNQVAITSIVTSHGQNDSGIFELNFNDERYLPFEGAGAVSEWQIKLPEKNNQFDFATISDVILHIKYTAIAGSHELEEAADKNLEEVLPSSGIVFYALKNDFSNEWHRFLHPSGTSNEQILSLLIKKEHLPFYAISKSINKKILVSKIDLLVDTPHDGNFDATLQFPETSDATDEVLTKDPNFGHMPHLEKAIDQGQATKVLGDWKIKLKKSSDPEYNSLKPEDINNAYLVVAFKIE